MSDGSLNYDITADASQMRAELKATDKEIAQMHGTLMRLASIAFGPLVAGMAGVTAAAGGLGLGVAIAAEREKARVAFKNIIGDAKEAARVFDELVSYTNTSPFQLDDVMKSAKTLAAAGVAAADLKDEIAVLGNVAGATGGSLSELARIFGQVKGTGHLMTRELYEFVNQGAGEVKNQLSRTLNVPIEKLAELGEQGSISFAMVRAALHDLAGEGGKWGHATAELGQTTLGLWSTLEDAIKQVGEAMGKPINSAIKPVLKDLTELADRLTPAMEDVGGVVAGMVTGIDDFLAHASKGSGVAAELWAAFKDMWDATKDYGAVVFAGLKVAAIGLGSALLEAVKPAGEALGHLFQAAVEQLQSGLHAALAEVYRAMERVPLLTDSVKAQLDGEAQNSDARSQAHSRRASREVGAASNVWENGHGIENMQNGLEETAAKIREAIDHGLKEAEARATGRKERREEGQRRADSEAEATALNKSLSTAADRRDAQRDEPARLRRNVEHIERGEPLEPKPEILRSEAEKRARRDQARQTMQLPPEKAAAKKETFDVSGAKKRPTKEAEDTFVKGGPGAGLALLRMTREALDAGLTDRAKATAGYAAKSDMPGGSVMADGLQRMAEQAQKAGSSELADRLLEMARKAMEAGDKLEEAGYHIRGGGNSIMGSLRNSARQLGAGNEPAFKIHGYDGKKQKAEEDRARGFAQRAWDGMDAKQKAQFNNDPREFIKQKQAEFADQGGTRNDWNKTLRNNPQDIFGGNARALMPRALTPEQLQRRGELFQRNQGGMGAPKAQSQDSGIKVTLQAIHHEVAALNTKFAKLEVA